MPREPGDWRPADFERHGRELLGVIREHFESIREVPVTVPRSSADLMALVGQELPETGEDFTGVLADTRERVMPYLVHWNHPSYHGYFSNSASFPGILAETLSAALNVNVMLWKSSPAAAALERVVLGWVARRVQSSPIALGETQRSPAPEPPAICGMGSTTGDGLPLAAPATRSSS